MSRRIRADDAGNRSCPQKNTAYLSSSPRSPQARPRCAAAGDPLPAGSGHRVPPETPFPPSRPPCAAARAPRAAACMLPCAGPVVPMFPSQNVLESTTGQPSP
jgi:hypothetical protein